MNYAKIVVKNNYAKRGDLVLRSYIRALSKIKAELLLDGDSAFIYGIIDEKGKFHELFTKEIIDYEYFTYIPHEEYLELCRLPESEAKEIEKVIANVLFGKARDFDFEISSIEDLARDRAVEFDAYDKFLSRINPYMRLSDNNQELYNAYNNFQYKIDQLKVMRNLDNHTRDVDLYDIYEYVEEVPKKLIKK